MGDTLGGYQLLALVGEGGMGRVWVARPLGAAVRRLVAVKTAISTQSQTPEFQLRFMDEARVASLAHHPSVCGVHELGEDRGILYLVMDWCDGATLRELLDWLPEERMAPAIAARIVASVASGLHAVHELQDADGLVLDVVHRDVSPHNVLIGRSGHVKVADFGVVKARGQLHAPTERGELKGKLDYMAPEQATGRDVDRRADVFALGCILYEATTGQRPFGGEGALATLYQLLEKDVTPPESILPGYCPLLARIVLRALAKDRSERHQTALELRYDLESWLRSHARGAVAEREVAKLMDDALGRRLDERDAAIAANCAAFEAPHPSYFSAYAAEPVAAESEVGFPSSLQGVTRAAGSGLPQSHPLPPLASLAQSLPWGWWPAGIAGACGVALLLAGLPAARGPVRVEPGAALPALARTAPEARLRVDVWPPHATVRVDDGPARAVGWVPARLDGRLHKVTISARGFVAIERWVHLDRARSVVVELEPIRSPAPSRP